VTEAPQIGPADLLRSASAEVNRVARWVADSHDNAGMPYLLVDKANATVFAFNSTGQLQATAPALLGMSHGDHLLVKNGTPMSAMPPPLRITPAGRFVAQLAVDSHDEELLVLDYDAAISMHPVIKGTPVEHRAERLASVTSQDNRISYGCINVPPGFYANYVSTAFAHTKGIVYVLPETTTAGQLFGFQSNDGDLPGTQTSTTASASGAAQAAPSPGAR